MVDVPLVLHGASGVPDEQIQECIQRGICKVNYATELRIAYTKAVREYLDNDKKSYDPKLFGRPARDAVKEVVCNRIKVLGSDGRCR
jgi:tagatose 1,6-diphosphate aldolase GatY/KbaY